MSIRPRSQKIELDLQKIKICFSCGPKVALIDLETSVTHTDNLIKIVTESRDGLKLLSNVTRDTATMYRGPGAVTKKHIRDTFTKKVNDDLQQLRKLGCPLGTKEQLSIIKDIKGIVANIHKLRWAVCTELIRPITRFDALSRQALHLNQSILSVMTFVRFVLDGNIENFEMTWTKLDT
jgi:hypothetical protein